MKKAERIPKEGSSAVWNKEKFRLWRQDFEGILMIALFYAVIEMMGVTCPIRFLTGISCAGCGMSRAWLALLRLDFGAAARYHPLFWLPALAAAVFLFRKHIPVQIKKGMAAVACILFLIVYIIRMMEPSDLIVTCSLRDGMLYRILSGLCGKG